jgi:cysteine desulfurase / selenocysteine lyase
MKNDPIYLDNAATSWPKPPCVVEAMTCFMKEVGANPGRAGHRRANEAAGIVFDVRERIAQLFNCDDPLRVVFGANVTEALNLALTGLLQPGDHVITTSMEHNSMMRPLRALERDGIRITVVPASSSGETDPDDIRKAIRSDTRLVAVNHASNVTGCIAPIREMGAVAREDDLLFLVDTAQSAGILSIDIQDDCIDLVAFTGHKSLYGPMGTGGLVIGERVDPLLRPLKRGGTGSRSTDEEQPDFLPDALECGTPNVVGLAGLGASLEWINDIGITAIREHEQQLLRRCCDALRNIANIRLYGPADHDNSTAIVSFNIEGADVSEVAQMLDEQFNVMCRSGLHCAPTAHRIIGTYPSGTVRFGIGYFTTEEDIAITADAVASIAREVS